MVHYTLWIMRHSVSHKITRLKSRYRIISKVSTNCIVGGRSQRSLQNYFVISPWSKCSYISLRIRFLKKKADISKNWILEMKAHYDGSSGYIWEEALKSAALTKAERTLLKTHGNASPKHHFFHCIQYESIDYIPTRRFGYKSLNASVATSVCVWGGGRSGL